VEDLPGAREYCEVRGPRSSLINNLVYPAAHSDGLSLGVHFTKTLWGTFLLGPTATYVEGKDNYEKNRLPIAELRAQRENAAAGNRRARPATGVFGGLRPKLVPPGGKGIADFVITRDSKVPQAIHLGDGVAGADGGAAAAEHVAQMVAEQMA